VPRLGAVLALTFLTACRPVGGPREGPSAPEDTEPPIRAGTSTATADSAAGVLITETESDLAAGRTAEAVLSADEVVTRYATARGSSRALLLLARAALAEGLFDRSLEVADRYAELFPPTDPRAAHAALVAATALHRRGDPTAAVDRLLSVPNEAVAAIEDGGLTLMREVVARLDNSQLASLASTAPQTPLAAPLLAEQAMAFYYRGDTGEAASIARTIQALVSSGPEAELASAILDGRVEDLRGALPVLGAMLAETGSPGLQDFSAQIREGIEVALEVHAETARRPVRLSALDDRGSPIAADAVIRRLEEEGALAVVGPLLTPSLEAAARARTEPTVLISPTSRTIPDGVVGVYSLAGPDPGASVALAEYVRDQGYQRVVLLRPSSQLAMEEARAFQETLQQYGLGLSRELAYDSGATFFQESLLEVAELAPEALVLPIPASDVELLAPQITFFGLDTLGIQVLGTGGWASESVVESVDSRHTTGVVAATATVPGEPPPGRARFVLEYESRLRKTLRSPIPALGFDAAELILEAASASGARTPEDLRRALEQIEDHEGATGTLSVREGRIVRAHHLVKFDSTGVLRPVPEEGGS
jgi:branched-chain amino acid transport system substrate-binding protein